MDSSKFAYTSMMPWQKNLAMAKAYTETYRRHQNDPGALREAHCLAVQYRYLFADMKAEDQIAGQLYYKPLIGFGLEFMTNESLSAVIEDVTPEAELTDETRDIRAHMYRTVCGHACDYSSLVYLRDHVVDTQKERDEIQELLDFWYENTTYYKYRKGLPGQVAQGLGKTSFPQYNSSFMRLCCISADYDKLIRLGIAGLREQVAGAQTQASGPQRQAFYRAALLALDIFGDVCESYRRQCLLLADEAPGAQRERLLQTADDLLSIQSAPPRTLRQGIQLFWLYYLLTDTRNFGRMDVFFGDLLADDLFKGRETEESALERLKELWELIDAQERLGSRNYRFNSRIIVGGKGRRNEENADRFALLAMRATEELNVCQPMLTLRFCRGQDPRLIRAALRCIKKGKVNPSLYNDDTHIPWCAKAYNVSETMAQNYIPQGCGEIIMDHCSIGSPNSIINYLTALDLVLHNGYSTEAREMRGLSFGPLDTFDKLLEAFYAQVDYTNDIFARRHAWEHELEGKELAFIFLSLLTDDCVARGKSIVGGGALYRGGIIETFGLTNVSDALYAIKTLVYDEKKYTLGQIVHMQDCNFEGYEVERQTMLNLPKYGNDHESCDALHTAITNRVCQSAFDKAAQYGHDFFLNCNLNPDGITYSVNTKASADGRLYGDSLAVGDAPTAGRDQKGITALMNTWKKSGHLCAGFVHNLKIAKNTFQNEPLIRSLLETFFETGGNHLMITVQDNADLIRATVEPEKYSHIMVRVGGWTARFVELSPHHQKEIIQRTMYS